MQNTQESSSVDLDDLIICQRCHTLQKRVKKDQMKKKAHCCSCGSLLYYNDANLSTIGLALSIGALILFFIANFFPLLKLSLLGHEEFVSIPMTIYYLLKSGFWLVGSMVGLMILLFPLAVMMLYFVIFILIKSGYRQGVLTHLFMLLSHLSHWNLADIFFISILIAVVKLIDYAYIETGVAFWSLFAFIVLDYYISRRLKLGEIYRAIMGADDGQ